MGEAYDPSDTRLEQQVANAMRVVLDTNIFVSGVFLGGLTGRILDAWRDRKLEPIVLREII
jgi:hypothetical protein